MVATLLLRNMPEPSNSQARRIRDEVWTLLHVEAAQQAESSASRRRGPATKKRAEPTRNEREVSVHQEPPPRGRKAAPVLEHLVDNQRRHNARHDINEHRRRRHGDTEECGYSAHHGGRYDSDEDRMAPEPPGPRVFSRAIHSTPFRPLNSIAKYNGETKPELWLADFWLACQLGGARGDDQAIIHQLPLFLSDTARRWLEELPATRSTTGPIWSGCSKETSRGPTYDPATHGISASASRNQKNLSESTLDAFRSSALIFRTSPTTTSFWPLSQAPRARIWCGNWVETDLRPSTN